MSVHTLAAATRPPPSRSSWRTPDQLQRRDEAKSTTNLIFPTDIIPFNLWSTLHDLVEDELNEFGVEVLSLQLLGHLELGVGLAHTVGRQALIGRLERPREPAGALTKRTPMLLQLLIASQLVSAAHELVLRLRNVLNDVLKAANGFGLLQDDVLHDGLHHIYNKHDDDDDDDKYVLEVGAVGQQRTQHDGAGKTPLLIVLREREGEERGGLLNDATLHERQTTDAAPIPL